MRQFYIPEILKTDKKITLSAEESKHVVRVLRMKTGDKLEILDGKGLKCIGEITDNNPKSTEVRILEKKEITPSNKHIHIAIAPTKSNDRLEWFLEKATEIGVDEISLILTANAERKVIKLERLEKIIVSAFKQSKRSFKPKLNALQTFSDFVKMHPEGLIAHCYENEKNSIPFCLKPRNCVIIIGPEGDFSESEVSEALAQKYTPISLGENRLRTETAGIYACTLAKVTLT